MRIKSRKKTKVEKISINDILPYEPYHFQFYWLDEADCPFPYHDFDGYLNNYEHIDTKWHFDFTEINGEHRGYVWDDGCFILTAYPLSKGMITMKLYQNNETKELVVIREQTEDSVKVKHLHAPVWETLTLEQFNEQYHVVEQEDDME